MQGFTTARRTLFAALVFCTIVHAAHAAPFILAEDGQAKCVIIHHPDATPPEQHAARELQRYLERITGATFERRAAEAPGEGRAILIGSGPWTEDVVSADERAALGAEGYILRTAGDGKRLHVIGGRPRGTLYGVYDLLRDEFACRWFTPRIERVPSRPTLTVDALDRTYVPPFEYRHIRYHMADDPDWAAKMHIHGYDRDRPELGGSFNYAQAWRVHTLRHFAPGGNHDPEDPSMADGDRAGLMSDALVEHAADTIRAVFDEQPEAEIVSLSQEDSVRRFDDEAARALIEREGSSSAVVLQFVNRVAERVAETHPEKVLSTLAYWWTIEPPETMRARENVAIRFAIMGAALNKPLTDPVNADYQSNLKGWSRLAERMYLWMYAQTGNKGGLAFSAPLPTVFVYDDDFRNIHEHGFDGVFVEGAYRLIDAFGELRSYVLSRLAWDPTLDAEPLIDEFLAGVYGDAAVYLRRYLDLLREADARHDQNIRYGFSVWDIRMFDAPTMLEAERLLDRAERAVAGGPESLRRRVRRFRLPHDGVMLAKWDDLAAEAAQQDLDWPSNREARLAQVEATANWWIEQRNERRPHSYALRRTRERVDEFVEEQRRLMALERKPLPAFFDQFDPEDVYSFTPERFRVGHREKWSVRRDDPEAASGRAAVQFGDVGRMQTTVLLQTIGLYDHRTPDQRWDVYVSAKVHADADMTGEAFCIGYHSRNDEHKRRHWISFDQVERGEYHLYKMPDLRLTEAGHLWLCPAGRDGIGEIYYDRFILVRQSE